jgi:hypothetical protein
LIRFFQNCCVWRATSLVVQVHISFDRGRWCMAPHIFNLVCNSVVYLLCVYVAASSQCVLVGGL